jgi:hypothetical protein
MGPGLEADHSPQSSADIKNSGVIPPLLYSPSWRGAYLSKHRDNFTFIPSDSTENALRVYYKLSNAE